MRKLIIAGLVSAALAVPGAGGAESIDGWLDEPVEGCQAFNPGQPTCTFTATRDNETPVSGAAGRGSWSVTVQRGKKKMVYKSPSSGEPTATGFEILEGDKVTAKALSAGSGVTTGGA